MITKAQFLKYIKFIEEQRAKQERLVDALTDMAPGCFCDAFVYDSYENVLVEILQLILEDTEDLIGYKLYEFDLFDSEAKLKQIEETPEVATWDTVYDYLVNKMQ